MHWQNPLRWPMPLDSGIKLAIYLAAALEDKYEVTKSLLPAATYTGKLTQQPYQTSSSHINHRNDSLYVIIIFSTEQINLSCISNYVVCFKKTQSLTKPVPFLV